MVWRGGGKWRLEPTSRAALRFTVASRVALRYRFLVYTGDFQQDQVEAEWTAFSKIK